MVTMEEKVSHAEQLCVVGESCRPACASVAGPPRCSQPTADNTAQCPCPELPRALWALVIRHALAAAAADGHRAVLKTAATFLAVSRHVSSAAHEVPLHLDMRQAPADDLQLLLPLLSTLPLHSLQLAPRHAGGAEALLRCDAVVALSGTVLRTLGATVACTDTLQRYPRLEELHLSAGVLERLYPAVLHGMPALRHLGLHGYKECELAALPPSLAATLQVLEVTPRPEAMLCQLSLCLPPGICLRHLTLHGSFLTVLSSQAAPQVVIDTQALCRQCRCARIEAQQAVWQLPASSQQQGAVEVALATALLDAKGVWERLELRLLEGAVVEVPPTLGPAGLPPRRTKLDLEQLVQAVTRLGGGSALASLRRESVSIFHPWVLLLQRRHDCSGSAAGAAGSGGTAGAPVDLRADHM